MPNDSAPSLPWHSLVTKNTGIVRTLAHRLGRRLGFDEAEAVGMLALVQAARSYRPEAGAFTTLAWISVRRAILRAVDKQQPPSASGKPATVLFTDLDATGETYDPTAADGDAEQRRIEDRDEIEHLLKCLPARSAQVVRLRFGLNDGGTEHSFAAIGASLGLSRTRVEQIYTAAMQKLANFQPNE